MKEREGGIARLGYGQPRQNNPSWVVAQPSLRCSSVGMSTELQHPFFLLLYYCFTSKSCKYTCLEGFNELEGGGENTRSVCLH